MKAIIYTRVASSDQTGVNLALEGQTRKLIDHCISNDIELVNSFMDIGSGHSVEREGWKELMNFVQNNEVDKVLVANWNRLSRNFRLAVGMRDELLSMGVEVQSIDNSELSSLIILMNRP